jgi:hypothetical protein
MIVRGVERGLLHSHSFPMKQMAKTAYYHTDCQYVPALNVLIVQVVGAYPRALCSTARAGE